MSEDIVAEVRADEEMVRYELVAGFPLYKVGTDGSVWSRTKGKPWTRLKWDTHPNGYPEVVLYPGKKKRKVHHLVLEAFVGPRPPGYVCQHYPDPSRTNCRLDNLSWVSAADLRRGPGVPRVAGTATVPGALRAPLTNEQLLAYAARDATPGTDEPGPHPAGPAD